LSPASPTYEKIIDEKLASDIDRDDLRRRDQVRRNDRVLLDRRGKLGKAGRPFARENNPVVKRRADVVGFDAANQRKQSWQRRQPKRNESGLPAG